ncbi:529_t:CDS:2 [Acaulospora morrowiae]|uniref:529_t:CDS:1 n=1 Tax=Acaulospora morrowiae TaxID=94023 RepID=A0A9N9GDG5_9GLOM|nr:529_t:CDS:2 [Acaulospora morrowiae]
MTTGEELLDELLEEDIEDAEGYYTENMDEKELMTNMEEEGPAVYLFQIEELPMMTDDLEKATIEEKIQQTEISNELNCDEQEQAKKLLLKKSKVFAWMIEELKQTNKKKKRREGRRYRE